MNDRFLPAASSLELPAEPGGRELGFALEEQGHERPSFELAAFLALLLRWRWLVLAVAATTAIAVIAATAFQTPLYRATATLELDPAPAKVVQDDDRDPARQTDRDYLALQIGLIKSRSVAERVSRNLNLGRDPAFLRKAPAPNATAADATGALLANLSASGATSDRIMTISYVHPNAAIAARVVNGFAEQAIENTFERSNDATLRSRAYLAKRLEATRQELERSERKLIEYARTANIVNVVAAEGPTSGDTAGGTLLASNLVALNTQLADAQNARIVAQERFAQAKASSTSASAADSTVQSLQQQRAQLQAEYDQKLNRLKPDFPDMVDLRSRVAGLDRQIEQASGRTGSAVVGSLRADFIAAQNRETQLKARIQQLQTQLLDLNDRGVRYTILKRAVDADRSMYNALLARLGEENSSATKTSGIALIDRAEVPGAPFSPNLLRAILLGILGGLGLGALAAVAAEKWYDTVNLPADVRDLLGLPVLGVIPRAGTSQDIDELLTNPRSAISEAYHTTRTNLQYLGSAGAPRSILFTSAGPSEGKTSTTIAIAADFISIGRRVVVVDGDLRHPSLRGKSREGGLSAVLTGACALEDAIEETSTPGLYLLHAGMIPPNPTVLLDSPVWPALVRALEHQFDVVIVDSPPVLGLADAPLLAGAAEATVLIIEFGENTAGRRAGRTQEASPGKGHRGRHHPHQVRPQGARLWIWLWRLRLRL